MLQLTWLGAAGMCVPAGLFMPTMFVGAKFGGATGFGVYWFLEHVAGQSALAQTIQPVQPCLQCAVAAHSITSHDIAQTCHSPRSAPPQHSCAKQTEGKPPVPVGPLVDVC